MISEFVYYMNRDALVTDQQVSFAGRRYELSLIKDAHIRSRHGMQSGKVEQYLRALSAATLLGAILLRLLVWGSGPVQTFFGVDMMLFTVSLLGLLVFGLASKPRIVVLLHKLNGEREALFECEDSRFALEFVQAVCDAAGDYHAGRGANARQAQRRKR